MAGSKTGSTPLEGAQTEAALDRATPSGDSPKRQGDKLGTGAAARATSDDAGRTADSPKRQGDELRHAVHEAAKR